MEPNAEVPTSGGRRGFLRAGATAATVGLAGCMDILSDDEDDPLSMADFRGSGPLVEGRPDVDAPSMADLPDLDGSLNIYLGGGEGGLYTDLLDNFSRAYDGFQPEIKNAPSAQLANTIVEEREGGESEADVFWAVDAGSLGRVADAGYAAELSSDRVQSVPAEFRPDDEWVGVAGRARAVPYNTDELSAGDVPDDVSAFATDDRYAGAMGWAPTYEAFHSFVTAMRVLEGRDATRSWLEGMLDQEVTEYRDEWFVSNAVADGEVAAGFANHYYALRVMVDRSDAPIDLAFTSGDAGALINASGVAVVDGTDNSELAANFVDHLLTAEAQEFFATRTFAYPMVADVPPVGGLPTIDELNPPDVSLQELADVEPTLDLLKEVGVL